jgi:hypothetical protein
MNLHTESFTRCVKILYQFDQLRRHNYTNKEDEEENRSKYLVVENRMTGRISLKYFSIIFHSMGTFINDVRGTDGGHPAKLCLP